MGTASHDALLELSGDSSSNMRVLVPANSTGNEKSNLRAYAAWLDATQGAWFTPNLRAYRDYLLHERQLAPISVRAHLSSVRTRYRDLLTDARDLLYALIPEEYTFEERKARVDEIEKRILNQLSSRSINVSVTKVQDQDDLHHIRLSPRQVNELIHAPGVDTLFGIRDTAMIVLMLCTGVREDELVGVDIADLETYLNGELSLRVSHGKGNKQRLIPYGELTWALSIVKGWLSASALTSGCVFRRIYKDGHTVGKNPLTTRAVQKILNRYSVWHDNRLIAPRPHDLRRTYARNLYDAGVDPIRIQQNLGHNDLKTTLGYIGSIDAAKRRPPSMYEIPKDILRYLDI